MNIRHIHSFLDGSTDCIPAVDVIGAKAHHLMQMRAADLPVPEGFALPAYLTFDAPYDQDSDIMMRATTMVRLAALQSDKVWGDRSETPYLVSVRSGAAVSMPGMMDTLLNVGLTETNSLHLAATTTPAFAMDCYARLVQGMATVVHGVPADKFAEVHGAASELFVNLDHKAREIVLSRFLHIYETEVGAPFPQNVDEQLCLAVNAVFASWMGEPAREYRAISGISDNLGTGCVIQGMRFGNLNAQSATGVLFSRDPNTGERKGYGEFLTGAQGEDVVSGVRSTRPIAEMPAHFPQCTVELLSMAQKLESLLSDMVDIEFTIEDGVLWLLQVRPGQRAAVADAKIVTDLLKEKVITQEEAVLRLTARISSSEGPTFNRKGGGAIPLPERPSVLLGTGLGASGGLVEGRAVFMAAQVDPSVPYIFIADTTSTADTALIAGSVGLVARTGGPTSHAAVVAREWGKSCVVGCMMTVGGTQTIFSDSCLSIDAGDQIWINGTTGEVGRYEPLSA